MMAREALGFGLAGLGKQREDRFDLIGGDANAWLRSLKYPVADGLFFQKRGGCGSLEHSEGR